MFNFTGRYYPCTTLEGYDYIFLFYNNLHTGQLCLAIEGGKLSTRFINEIDGNVDLSVSRLSVFTADTLRLYTFNAYNELIKQLHLLENLRIT